MVTLYEEMFYRGSCRLRPSIGQRGRTVPQVDNLLRPLPEDCLCKCQKENNVSTFNFSWQFKNKLMIFRTITSSFSYIYSFLTIPFITYFHLMRQFLQSQGSWKIVTSKQRRNSLNIYFLLRYCIYCTWSTYPRYKIKYILFLCEHQVYFNQWLIGLEFTTTSGTFSLNVELQ
jgi:hypothetical protein